MSEPDFHDPARPTRYVTPDEFGVGQNYVAGCPECAAPATWVRVKIGWFRHRWVKRWAPPTPDPTCDLCKGFGTVLYVATGYGSFAPQPR